eukprot:gene4824-3459_t
MGNGIVHKQLNPAVYPNSLSGSSHIISEPVDSICSIFAAKPDLKEVFITFLRDEKWIERFHQRADDITSYNPTSQLCYPQYITPTGDVFGSKDSSLCKKKGIRAVSHRSTLSHTVSSSNLNADTKKKAKKTKECMKLLQQQALLHPGDAAAAGAESPTKTTTAALLPAALSLSRQNSSSLHSNHAPSPKLVRVPHAAAAKRGPVVNEDESLDDLLKASTSAMDIDMLMPKLASSDWLREMFNYLDAFPYAITIASVIPNSSSVAPDFAYCFANQAFEAMTKYRRHALLGRATSSILFHPHKTEAAQIDRINQSLSQRKSVKLAMTCGIRRR